MWTWNCGPLQLWNVLYDSEINQQILWCKTTTNLPAQLSFGGRLNQRACFQFLRPPDGQVVPLLRIFSAPPAAPGDPAGFGPSVPDAAHSVAAPPPAVSPSGHEVVLASHAFLPPSWPPGSLVQLVVDGVALSGPVCRVKSTILTESFWGWSI